MELRNFYQIVEDIQSESVEAFTKRNASYNNTHGMDVLANFKDVAVIANQLGIEVTTAEVAFLLFILKVVRERSNKQDVKQGIKWDSVVDAMNYYMFYLAAEMEDDKWAKDTNLHEISVQS